MPTFKTLTAFVSVHVWDDENDLSQIKCKPDSQLPGGVIMDLGDVTLFLHPGAAEKVETLIRKCRQTVPDEASDAEGERR